MATSHIAGRSQLNSTKNESQAERSGSEHARPFVGDDVMTTTETIKVTWITQDGANVSAHVALGHSLMEAAIANDISGIIGDCGGALACATCHVHVEYSPVDLSEKKNIEIEMLEFADAPPSGSSRLSCQIKAARELDGLVLRVPAQ